MRSPVALAWRLHRGALLAWTAGFALLGIVMGAATEGIEQLLADNPAVADLLSRLGGQAALTDAYLASMMAFIGLIAAGYAIQATQRLRGEEAGLRAEPLLTASVSRTRWAASPRGRADDGADARAPRRGRHRRGSSRARRRPGAASRRMGVDGIATALFGLLPRLALAAWAALAVLELPERLLDMSPFTHVPALPGGEVAAAPLLGLLAVAAALTAAGLLGWCRRDVVSTG